MPYFTGGSQYSLLWCNVLSFEQTGR